MFLSEFSPHTHSNIFLFIVILLFRALGVAERLA
jgi:hypothetical protein